MKKHILTPLVLALGLAFGGAAMAADAVAGAGGVYANENANGSVELSNISTTDNQEPVVAAPDPAAAAAAPTEVPQKDPREAYHDKMVQGTDGTAANPAVSRRYKMMDRETYRTKVLGITPETPSPTMPK